MSNEPADIFTKLGSETERQKLMADLIRLKVELICKLENSDELIRVEIVKSDENRLTCALRKGSRITSSIPAKVIVSFELVNEKFFINTTLLSLQAGYYELTLKNIPIFRLQRRQNYRVRIPEKYINKVSINYINDLSAKIAGSIGDLSVGGFRLKIIGERRPLKTGDQITGEIHIGNKDPFFFHGVIRHERYDSVPPTAYYGVEFVDLPTQISTSLFSLTLELHREIFSKLK